MKKNYFLVFLCFFLSWSFSWAQLSKEYEVTTPGTLSQLAGTDKNSITDLALTGTINNVDFQTIREMKALKNLNLERVNLVDDIIPNSAFYAKVLNKIILPKSLKVIKPGAFSGSTIEKLDFTLCSELTSIEGPTFSNSKIAQLDFSKNLKLTEFYTGRWWIGVFTGYSGKVILPENLKIIPNSTFAGFKGQVELPDSVEEIDAGAFANASSPISLKLPKNLKVIRTQAFINSTIQELDFTLCSELTRIEEKAFSNSKIAQLDFSKNLKLTELYTRTWWIGTFTDYSGKVILPENLKIIPNSTFAGFKGQVELPDSVEEIDAGAFANASSPFSLKLPKNLKVIRTQAFINSTIQELDFTLCSELTRIEEKAFSNSKIAQLDFSKNLKLTELYTRTWWIGTFTDYSGRVILPENLKIIPNSSFAGFKGQVELPDSVEEIDAGAFANASSPISLKLPKNLKVIRTQAFINSTIQELDFTLCSELTRIEEKAFSNSKIAQLDFSKNLKLTELYTRTWWIGTFTDYSGRVILPENLKIIPNSSFAGFKGQVELPDSVEEIDAGAFANASSPFSLKLPKNLKVIRTQAFINSTIQELDFTLCSELTRIEEKAFSNSKIAQLDFSKNLKLTELYTRTWGIGTFTDYSGRVILPENLKIVINSSFAGFKGEVELPDSVEEIEAGAFANSTIKEIDLPSNLKTINTVAFSNCLSLEKITSRNPIPPQLGVNVFSGMNLQTVQLCVPKESLSLYKQAAQWKDFPNYCEIVVLSEQELSRGPNTYIFDIDKANANNYGGLEIPVIKAYAAWKTSQYLNKPIPNGTLSASVVWEEHKDLIRSLSIDQNGEKSQLKVMINKNKGKGNAVIAFHVGDSGDPKLDPIYWSWHIWITDDPTKGAYTYESGPGYSAEVNNVNTFMDRNLGALSNTFLGDDWNKSGGLMYQWGRKDPFPSFRYKGAAYNRISSMYGSLTAANQQSILNKVRPYDYVGENIQESIKNPLNIFKVPAQEHNTKIGNTNRFEPDPGTGWFASKAEISSGKSYDLWADNNKGYQTNLLNMTQQPKSEFDPCPSGWRVPSYGTTIRNDMNNSPWGVLPSNDFYPELFNKKTVVDKYKEKNLKIYYGLGFDFTGMGANNMGILPLTGHYVNYYDFASGPTNQDEGSEGSLLSASFGPRWGTRGQALGLHLVADFGNPHLTSIGSLASGTANGLGAVRCVKVWDQYNLSNEFPTVYLPSETKDYTEGLENPNSYMVVKSEIPQTITIPVNKAYAVYNQYLTDHDWPKATDRQSVNVYWTTHTDLLGKPRLVGTGEKAEIEVTINPNKTGNAVVSLHSGSNNNSKDPVLWSWHIWVTKDALETVTYTTEEKYSPTKNTYDGILAFNTTSGMPPLTTTFMDRNLGALESDILSDDSGGMHYQWGRKDPLPSFTKVGGAKYTIYLGSTVSGNLAYSPLDGATYLAGGYPLPNQRMSLKDAAERPLHYVYNPSGSNGWVDSEHAFDETLWGHASKKSVFDPCPSEWRIPDTSGIGTSNSPWLKEGTADDKLSVYGGVYKQGRGYIFNSSQYNIGQFPKSGIIGLFGSPALDFVDDRLWTASMKGDQGLGTPFLIHSDIVRPVMLSSPALGLSVRCAKDEPRFTKESIANPPVAKTVFRSLEKTKVQENNYFELTESQIQITPNPNSGIFRVILTDIPQGMVQVMNINGAAVFSGTFKGNTEVEVNIKNQPAGIYVVRVQSGQQTVIKKVIKN